jgi:hypothetical protein
MMLNYKCITGTSLPGKITLKQNKSKLSVEAWKKVSSSLNSYDSARLNLISLSLNKVWLRVNNCQNRLFKLNK